MRQGICLVLLSMFLLSCGNNKNDTNKIPLVVCKGHTLYKEDVWAILPTGLNQKDSTEYVDSYIKSWIDDILLYEIARNNISNSDEINALVERYHRSLIVYQYQQQLIDEKVKPNISEEDIEKYYVENTKHILLNEDIIKGLFLKVPIDAPNINSVKEWYASPTSQAIESIEKYSIQNAVEYDYFYDKWVSLDKMMERIPYTEKDFNTFTRNNRKIETQDSSFYYFLYADEFKSKGEEAPLEYARNTIRETLVNHQKMIYMQEFLKELYQKESKNIKINK